MRSLFLLLAVMMTLNGLVAQVTEPNQQNQNNNDHDGFVIPEDTRDPSLKNRRFGGDDADGAIKKDSIASIDLYKIISHSRDTTFVDTTLSIQKEYRYNYLRTDDFEFMPFSNIGQPYNNLSGQFDEHSIFPRLGAKARNLGYFEVEDMSYYNVATPITEFFFKTTLEEGQLLDARLSFNTSKQFNLALAYTGFRSLGKYQFDQARSGRFRATLNYMVKNQRYGIRAHYAGQELEGEENGGLLNRVEQFESGDDDFLNRDRVDVVYTDASNKIVGKRYFFEHQYNFILPKKDSINGHTKKLSLQHRFFYETKFYEFEQTSPHSSFGAETFESSIADRSRLRYSYNDLALKYSSKDFGRLSLNASLFDYDYSLGNLLILNDQRIENRIEDNDIVVGADYHNVIGNLKVDGKIRQNVAGDLTDSYLAGIASYRFGDLLTLNGGILRSSRKPNFNFLLYQSDYVNFNWNNSQTFENQELLSLRAGFESKLFGKFSAAYNSIDNYTYFGLNSDITDDDITNGDQNAFVRPFQESGSIDYLKLRYDKGFKWRKWALDNSVMYQDVSQDNQVLNLPELTVRSTLSFSSFIFKKAMFIQPGVTIKYFDSYNMDAYNPLLGEFYTQNIDELGAYPLIDVFINARVRRTRIYFKAEHLNTVWDQDYDYYSAPNYPYRDFVIRFGLVWNFFS